LATVAVGAKNPSNVIDFLHRVLWVRPIPASQAGSRIVWASTISHGVLFSTNQEEIMSQRNAFEVIAEVLEKMDTRTVTIPAKDEHEGFYTLTLTLPWFCLACGGPRGEPFPLRSYDGSRHMVVDGWKNECGHVEKYSMVRAAITSEAA
jgi:hypothetical protein